MPYTEKLELSEISPALLPSLKDFIEGLLDLSELYGEKITMPVGYPPRRQHGFILRHLTSTAAAYPSDSDSIKGIYQDEVLLQESVQARLDRVTTLKKLGAILKVSPSTMLRLWRITQNMYDRKVKKSIKKNKKRPKRRLFHYFNASRSICFNVLFPLSVLKYCSLLFASSPFV